MEKQKGMNDNEGMLYEKFHAQKTKRGILQILVKTNPKGSQQLQEIFSNIIFTFVNSVFNTVPTIPLSSG